MTQVLGAPLRPDDEHRAGEEDDQAGQQVEQFLTIAACKGKS